MSTSKERLEFGGHDTTHWLMNKFTDFYLDFFNRMLTAASGRIDILRVADDFLHTIQHVLQLRHVS